MQQQALPTYNGVTKLRLYGDKGVLARFLIEFPHINTGHRYVVHLFDQNGTELATASGDREALKRLGELEFGLHELGAYAHSPGMENKQSEQEFNALVYRYKQLTEGRNGGAWFSPQQVQQLERLRDRREYKDYRREFARWLVEHGRLSDW